MNTRNDATIQRCAPLSLQESVDALAARLARPVVVEDHDHRIVAHSSHDERIDEVRRLSILHRRTSHEVMTRLRQFGIERATAPVRIPACPDLGMWPRLCVPVRHRTVLLGYVWLLDRDGTVSDAEIEVAAEACGELALEMYRERRTSDVAGHRIAESVRNLLSADRGARASAVHAVVGDGYLMDGAPVVALVAQPMSGYDRPAHLPALLEEALVTTVRSCGPRSALHLTRYDQAVIVAAQLAGHPTAEDTAARLLTEVRRTTCEAGTITEVLVGVGGEVSGADQAAESYQQAQLALRVAAVQPEIGPVARWADMGIYRALTVIAPAHLSSVSIHPRLERMFADPANAPLLQTLEIYLDLAGNADSTARRLHLHRTSLYYRLQRVEQLAKTTLKDGSERLCLHLALKVGRLTGAYHPAHPPR